MTADEFGRAKSTVSKCFYLILSALQTLYNEVVKAPQPEVVQSEIEDDPRMFPFFRDCLGAIDGTHIAAHVPRSEQVPFSNRKGNITQNVFAACSFDLRITHIHAGWEGSAHDSIVMQHSIAEGRWRVPEGKYYLADAGYSNCDFLLVPYQKVRYHLKEWATSNLRPQDPKELFNKRHATLRNAIERLFGVLKRKWKVLAVAPEISVASQVNIVLAVAAIHNFIISMGYHDDPDFQRFDDEKDEEDEEKTAPLMPGLSRAGTARMNSKRADIAEAMWSDYRVHRIGRGLGL